MTRWHHTPDAADGAHDAARPTNQSWRPAPAPTTTQAPATTAARMRVRAREEPATAGPAAAEEPGPERLYVLTGGRGGPSGRTRLDLVTLVVAVGADGLGPAPRRTGLFPEHTAILRLCRRPLSAAELSAHLRLPFSATAVLVDDLVCAGLVTARSPRRIAALPDPDLIREVLSGLQRL